MFNSTLLPPYLKRAKNVEEFLPWLYLKGISTGDYGEALQSLLGENAEGLSANTISRLKEKWMEEHREWNRRDLSDKKYVYWWAWNVLRKEYPECVHQRCWVHKTANVLNKVPKSLQGKVKADLR